MPKSGKVGMASKGKKAITAIQVVLAVLVVAGVAWLAFKAVGYNQAQRIYNDIDAAYASEVDGAYDGEPSPIDFAALQAEYPNVVGWLKMEDVNISYPIVKGEDNDYYLHHDPSGAENIDGSIFADYRTISLDTDLHVLLYGHNMQDESMFGQLDDYTNEEFYKRGTGLFYIYTPTASYRYKIFAVDIVDPSSDVYQTGFTNPQVFGAYVRGLKESSMYETGVDVNGYDQVVTLSTCSDTNRLVLSAKRM
jgi:sortase B